MRTLLIAMTVCLSISANLHAEQLRVTVTNLQPNDGFYLTPVWAGFHNGGFDFFDPGAAASASLEALAEEGIVAGLRNDFANFGSGVDEVITGSLGFGSSAGQPPVLDPGESASTIISVNASDRYLSFATMIIPSNDGFLGSASGTDIEIFDAFGQLSFAGPLTIGFGSLWDAGTELNDGLGAAFSANGGNDSAEANPIGIHGGLANFDGSVTAAGSTINVGNASSFPLLRIDVVSVPEPNGIAVCSGLSLWGLRRRRRATEIVRA